MSELFDDIVQGFDEIADRQGNQTLKSQTQKYIKKEKCIERNPIFCKRRFYSWTHPIKNIRQFFRCIKWSSQRIQKGYSDIDIGDFDVWMSFLLQGALSDFKEAFDSSHSLEDEQNLELSNNLAKLSYLLRESNDDFCEDSNTNDYCKERDEYCDKRLEEFFDLFKKYYHWLWL